MGQHEKLCETAKEAADRLFADRSVSLDETFRSLGDVRVHIEILMDAVASDMPTDEEDFHDLPITE